MPEETTSSPVSDAMSDAFATALRRAQADFL